jgi:hypothetical protein
MAPGHGTFALAGPGVSQLCQLNVDDIDLTKARFYLETPRRWRAFATSTSTRGSSTS